MFCADIYAAELFCVFHIYLIEECHRIIDELPDELKVK